MRLTRIAKGQDNREYMNPEMIGLMERPPKRERLTSVLSAVLFENGQLVELEDHRVVYGLVLAGYQGLKFGDDGVFTAFLASELPLDTRDRGGMRRLEGAVAEAVARNHEDRWAEFIDLLTPEEAGVKLRQETRYNAGVPYPQTVSWDGGSRTL